MAGWYMVYKGRWPGVYSWCANCQEQVHVFSGASYYTFKTYEDAMLEFNSTHNSKPVLATGHGFSQPETASKPSLFSAKKNVVIVLMSFFVSLLLRKLSTCGSCNC
jgi:viroplasmin and RNaseH domain-containing protein